MSMRLLLADDDPQIQLVARLALEQVGFTVDVAATGEELLRRVAECQPDGILLDMMMPGAGGLATCRALKDRPETAGVPVIFLSARSRATEIRQGVALGAVGYITKPFDPLTLGDRVKTLLAAPTGSPTALDARVSDTTGLTSDATTSDPVDPAALARLERVRPDLVRRVIDLFLDSTPERVDILRVAQQRGDVRAVERAAHALRSSAANFGATRLVELTGRIERHAESDDATPLADLIVAAVQEVERLQGRLEELRREG